MSWAYRSLLRPLLFRWDSEAIHNRTLKRLAEASQSRLALGMMRSVFRPAPLPVEVFGLKFPNPVGLAAGMDKEGAAVPAWAAMGFGFSELGGVTWHAQPGNTAPRVFRAVPDEALVNRMGFNNSGAEAMARRLADWRSRGLWPDHPVGINLGKSKVTPLADAAQDYSNSLRVLWPHADFFVVNVSSPNTPNLRQLQDKAALDEILAALQEVNSALSAGSGPLKPILVKVAPDLSWPALDEILELTGPRNVAGIVATNTTTARPEAALPELQRVYAEAGGLSGRPLAARSTEVIRHLHRQTKGRVPVIGVGGIFNAADAWEKIRAGASLVQVYTGLVYEGPGLARGMVAGLGKRLREGGLTRLEDAVGGETRPPGGP
jgi:dihydroorotate dehydrogenase